MPLDSVLVLCMTAVVVCDAGCESRNRRRNFGMSNGSSPRSTDVALPEVQAS